MINHSPYFWEELLRYSVSGVLIVCPFLYEQTFLHTYWMTGLLIGYFTSFFIVLFVSTKREITISFLDILILLFFIYRGFHLFFLRKDFIDGMNMIEDYLLLIIYFSFRLYSKSNQKSIIYVFIISGVIQSLYGILQYYHIFYSNHVLFRITGAFFNPGPFGGYLAICFVFAFSSFCENFNNTHKRRVIYAVSLTIIGYAIILSESRAAWLSIFLVLLYVSTIRLKSKKSKFLYVTIIIMIVCSGLILTSYKKDSINSRLFIWHVTRNMIREKPIFGHGVKSFPALYMNYQEKYFIQHPHSEKSRIADNNQYAYNEFLRITAETGVIGLSFILLILCTILFHFIKSSCRSVFFSALFTYVIFSLFSYPGDIFPIKMILPIIVAFSPSKVVDRFALKTFFKIFAYAIMLSVFLVCTWLLNKYRIFDEGIGHINKDSDTEVLIQNLSPIIKNNPTQMMQFGNILYSYELYPEALYILQQANLLYSSVDNINKIGIISLSLSMNDLAESCFKRVTNMTPAYITPFYQLLLLYQKEGLESEALFMAKHIVEMEVKIINTTTIRIKKEAEELCTKKSIDLNPTVLNN